MPAPLDTAPAPAPPEPGKDEEHEKRKMPALAEGPARFIPVSRYGLKAKLVEMLVEGGGDRKAWGRALDCLASWRHQDHRKKLLNLLENYLPFSPTATPPIRSSSIRPSATRRGRISSRRSSRGLTSFALSRDDVQRLLIERSPYGLHLNVDLTELDEALLYYRGTGGIVREERNPWRLYLTKDRHEIPIFQRLFLLLKLKPDETRIAEIMAATGATEAQAARVLRKARAHLPLGVSSDYIYVKMFKRIPQIDLEMLFPNTKVAFRPFDKLKLMITAGGGTVAGVTGTATKLLAVTNPITLDFGIAGLSAVVFRQVMKFFNTRNRYMMVLAQNLYFHSLANNHGALTLIADRAEEEDVKEDMLLYAFLARHPAKYDALPEIKNEVASFLKQRCGVGVDFDAEDALRRLLTDGLVRTDPEGNLTAIAPDEARAHLDTLWDRVLDTECLDHAAARS